MFTALVILILIAAVLMIGIVLIQKSKGGGLASNFAGYNQIGGVRKTTSFIEKATWVLAVVICVLSILSSFFYTIYRYFRFKSSNNSNRATGRPFNTEAALPATPVATPDSAK